MPDTSPRLLLTSSRRSPSLVSGLLLVAAGVVMLAACAALGGDRFRPAIPRTWDEAALASCELPLFDPERSPKHVSAEFYYGLPVRPIYRSYPVYHPDREPEGYREWLAQQQPEVVFDAAELVTEQDWIDAGELVFDQPIEFDGPIVTQAMVDDADWFARHAVPLASDGVMPFARWVVREPGKVELGNVSCAMCHTRVLDDGRVVKGAQGNFPFDEVTGADFRNAPEAVVRSVTHTLVAAPWAAERGAVDLDAMSKEQICDAFARVPAGALIRQGVGLWAPARVPDLIGIEERAYLDSTGFVQHRSIGDLMRYAALNQGMDTLAEFGDLRPAPLPKPGGLTFAGADGRYSDAQLYALSRFVYSLEPPENPNAFDALAQRGQQVFDDEGCARCHTPPLYTSNKLLPVDGFRPPKEHYERFDVARRRVGTDPELATATRRGTGYYKVPSLKGLWYRGPLEHSGSVATLEDWFDARRQDDGYVPTGYVGRGPRAVPGHDFGLDLDPEDKRALIAFLRTL